MSKYNPLKAAARKKILRDIFGGKCQICGSTDKLHFDHIDPSTKLFGIAMAIDRSWEILLKEVEKCQLLCKACHLEKHGKRRKAEHGTPAYYNNYKCRCIECIKSWNEYCKPRKRAWRALKQAKGDA